MSKLWGLDHEVFEIFYTNCWWRLIIGVSRTKKIKNSCLSLFLISIVSEVREMSCDYGAKECPWKWIMKKQKQISKIKKKRGGGGVHWINNQPTCFFPRWYWEGRHCWTKGSFISYLSLYSKSCRKKYLIIYGAMLCNERQVWQTVRPCPLVSPHFTLPIQCSLICT